MCRSGRHRRICKDKFMRWYNTEHRHSGIGYVAPEQRYTGEDRWRLRLRDMLHCAARARRWNVGR